MLDQAAIRRLIERIQDGLQEIIGFFQLIPEHLVILRKLEGLEVQLFHDFKAKRIESGKQPAAAGRLLIGHIARF